jgi:hypothetical protein
MWMWLPSGSHTSICAVPYPARDDAHVVTLTVTFQARQEFIEPRRLEREVLDPRVLPLGPHAHADKMYGGVVAQVEPGAGKRKRGTLTRSHAEHALVPFGLPARLAVRTFT